MKLLLLVLLANLLCFANTAMYRDERTKGTGRCIYQNNVVLAPNQEIYILGECMKASCTRDSILDVVGCGTVSVMKGGNCWVTTDKPNASYPACCPRIKCRN